MFRPGSNESEVPSAGDLMVGVHGSHVRLGRFADFGDTRFGDTGFGDTADVHLIGHRDIGHRDEAPVWAGVIEASDDLRPWVQIEHPDDEIVARAVYSVQWRITHRFCGECGGRLDDCPGFPTRRCPTCTTIPYVPQALTPAIVVAITSSDRILLVRHAEGPRKTMWALVAGMVEASEALEATVAREVREEVGLEITNIRYARSKGFSLDNPGALMVGFTADCASDAQPRVDGVELTDARWFTRAEFAALPGEEKPPPYAFAWPLIEAWRNEAWRMSS